MAISTIPVTFMSPFLHPKLSVYNLAWSTDWNVLFGAERPLIVEIGFGNGAYITELASQNPDCNIIGLEIASKSLEKVERKLGAAGLNNARVIFSKAEAAIPRLFTPRSVREFHINYPDPWFKTRHSGRRLMQRDTLDTLVSRMVIGGKLYLATDIVDYAQMSHELLAETSALTNLLDVAWTNQIDRLATTKYEAKGFAEGRIGNYFSYQRNDHPHHEPPVEQELDMPHIVIATPMPANEILSHSFIQQFNPAPNIHIKIRDAFIHQNGKALMFEAEIIEPTIEQHVAIMLYPRDEPNEFTVKYTTLGQPRMTPGLHYATHLVATWVIGLHPEGKILSSKVAV